MSEILKENINEDEMSISNQESITDKPDKTSKILDADKIDTKAEVETVIDNKDVAPEGDISENIMAMLPIGGNTDPGANPQTFIDDLTKETDGEVVPDGKSGTLWDKISEFNVADTVSNNKTMPDEILKKVSDEFLTEAANTYNLSKTTITYLLENAMCKEALARTVDKDRVVDLKRKMINNQREVNKISRTYDIKSKKNMNKFSIDAHKAINKAIDKSRKDAKFKTISGEGPKTNKINYLKEQIDMVAEKYYETDSKSDRNTLDLLMKEFDEAVKEALFGNEVITEAKDMEEDIKPIVTVLNSKGYKVNYASSGHPSLIKDGDYKEDKIYYDKFYSDARIVFDKKYNFGEAPEYWEWKPVKNNVSYLDITPIDYDREKDGSNKEAHYKWKRNYMNSLKEWVKNLPSRNVNESTEEEVTESIGSVTKTVVVSIILSALIDLGLLAGLSIKAEISKKRIKSIKKLMPLYAHVHNLIPADDISVRNTTVEDLNKIYEAGSSEALSKFLNLNKLRAKLALDEVEDIKLFKTVIKTFSLTTYIQKSTGKILFIANADDNVFLLEKNGMNVDYAQILISLNRYYVTPGFKKFCKEEKKYLTNVLKSKTKNIKGIEIIDDRANKDEEVSITESVNEIEDLLDTMVESIEESDESFGFESTDTVNTNEPVKPTNTDTQNIMNATKNNPPAMNSTVQTTPDANVTAKVNNQQVDNNQNNNQANFAESVSRTKLSEQKMRAFKLYHEGVIDKEKYDSYNKILNYCEESAAL